MVARWVCLCAFLSCTGWLLSGLHALNRIGYLVAFGGAAVALRVWQRRTGGKIIPAIHWSKLSRRFRRGFPLAFLVLSGMAILGGALHTASNYDGLTYRTPRVLHWLAAEQWHWVQTDFPRLNVRATGYEWVSAPLIAFTRTDRWLFCITSISFLLLPGLVFSSLYRLGVRRRVAWHWMWLLPTGYTYLLQAGSISNDLFGAVFGFAAIDFALRARTSRRVEDVWLSILAAALVTNTKALHLLLGLPWLIAIWPALKLMRRKLLPTGAVGLVAIVVSLIPISYLNLHYCGDWSGQALEHAAFGGVPALRLPVNAVKAVLQNFAPPIFPWANAWNRWVDRTLPPQWDAQLQAHFESGAAQFHVGEMEVEEAAGLGLGVCGLFVLTLAAVWLRKRPNAAHAPPCWRNESWVGLAGWLVVIYFMTQSGLSTVARYLAPYNVILLAPFLVGDGHSSVVRKVWWRRVGAVIFALAGLLLIVNLARPLWPAVLILRGLDAENSSHPLVRRAWSAYVVKSKRTEAFAPALAILPPDANPLGIVSFDDPETSLWRPFGQRRILHVTHTETGADLRRRGIKYVLASSETLTVHWTTTPDAWQTQVDGEVMAEVALKLRGAEGPKPWYLVRIR